MNFIEETLKEAGEELSSRFGQSLEIKRKKDESLVTDADLASERVIIERLKAQFPDDLIYSEESGLSSEERNEGDNIWIIDPLDGTTNFANRYPFFCVSIGRGVFQSDGSIRIESGGIFDPVRQACYLAQRGEGSTCNGRTIRCSGVSQLDDCFLVTGFYYHKGATLEEQIKRFRHVADRCQGIRRDGAAALDLAFVAEGIYDGFWEYGLAPWDLAAGILLVEEAGGTVANYGATAGSPYDIEGSGLIAGPEKVCKELSVLVHP